MHWILTLALYTASNGNLIRSQIWGQFESKNVCTSNAETLVNFETHACAPNDEFCLHNKVSGQFFVITCTKGNTGIVVK